ncbi:cytochrome P450 [Desarmillaria tabescens]|uniref:Cytochrome P450 n=1 Tax=Armillaria tabescens TaxID=1929756 RepID=A0AA39MPH3_ARMTA|nr:cytochrome P450 [Desarmillaria tabescens]KAK0442306.1 cytochrome P450 [Desarmillaria tabescens]
MSLFSLAFASILAVALLRWWLKRISVKHVEGPPSASFWLGHELVLRSQDEFGDLETKWRSEYGTIYRIRGCFGQDLLVVSDPKAFEHIFHTSRPYPKTSDTNFIFGLILGGTEGLIVVEKDVHRRQRKILNPAFSPANLRDYQVIFQRCSDKVVNAMKISTGTGEKIDVVDWMGKVSLDIIGLSAFRYDFGSLDGQDTELGEAMKHLFTASQSDPSALELMVVALIRMLPHSVLKILKLCQTRETRQLASVGETARKIAREILAAQAKLGVQDELDKDIVDILTRARLTGQMSDDEIELQFMTFLIAGHETTSATLSWLLYELAAHPEHQSIIREEVKHSYHNDYDSLPFLNAAIKEVLRFHPMVHAPMRTAPYDDILPLSGSKTLTIPKGQTLLCSVYSYNRLPSIWGDDAEKWNPSRFLEKSIPVSLGVYANLMTFSSGSRSCIGWRFAVMEMQTILANLIQNFEFSLPEGTVIQQFPGSQAIVPVVKGEAHLGSRVPLRIRSLE